MKVSTKGLYGALAVMDLAIHYSSGHVHKADIAERQGIPEQYLAQLLSILRRAGYVKSIRGPQGGHTLARPPADISLAEVVELLDGPQVAESPEAPPSASRAVIASVLRDADEAAVRVLSKCTFDTIVERWRRSHGSIDFVI